MAVTGASIKVRRAALVGQSASTRSDRPRALPGTTSCMRPGGAWAANVLEWGERLLPEGFPRTRERRSRATPSTVDVSSHQAAAGVTCKSIATSANRLIAAGPIRADARRTGMFKSEQTSGGKGGSYASVPGRSARPSRFPRRRTAPDFLTLHRADIIARTRVKERPSARGDTTGAGQGCTFSTRLADTLGRANHERAGPPGVARGAALPARAARDGSPSRRSSTNTAKSCKAGRAGHRHADHIAPTSSAPSTCPQAIARRQRVRGQQEQALSGSGTSEWALRARARKLVPTNIAAVRRRGGRNRRSTARS